MVALQIDEALAEKLTALANSQGRSIQATLAEVIDYYTQTAISGEFGTSNGLELLIGMAEADVNDLSIRAREYLSNYPSF